MDQESPTELDPLLANQAKPACYLRVWEHRGKLFMLAGPILASIPLWFDLGSEKIAFAALVTIWMGFYWMTEAIPLAATAFFPLILFPCLGVLSAGDVAKAYFNDTLVLLLASFIYAACLERWNLHEKLALKLLLMMGTNPKVLMLGFMMISCFVSMWISNTATTAMLTPLVLAVVQEIETHQRPSELGEGEEDGTESTSTVRTEEWDAVTLMEWKTNDQPEGELQAGLEANGLSSEISEQIKSYTKALLLGLAYSSSIGGVGTLIGTGTNLIFVEQLRILFPESPEVSFGLWFGIFGPFSFVVCLLAYCLLLVMYARKTDFEIDSSILERKYEELGPVNFPQKVLIVDFFVMAFLWFTRAGFGDAWRGWSTIFLPRYVTDGTVCLFGTIILFFIPDLQNGTWDSKTGFVLDNNVWKLVHWDAVLLLAGGFGMASGISSSGLSEAMSHSLRAINEFQIFFLLFSIVAVILFMTEFTSNVSTITIFLPILAALAVSGQQDPRLLMMAGTVASSYAFMLPVATPPNTIVFGTGVIPVTSMAFAGLWLNLISVFLIPAYLLLTTPAFGIHLGVLPDWANTTKPK